MAMFCPDVQTLTVRMQGGPLGGVARIWAWEWVLSGAYGQEVQGSGERETSLAATSLGQGDPSLWLSS